MARPERFGSRRIGELRRGHAGSTFCSQPCQRVARCRREHVGAGRGLGTRHGSRPACPLPVVTFVAISKVLWAAMQAQRRVELLGALGLTRPSRRTVEGVGRDPRLAARARWTPPRSSRPRQGGLLVRVRSSLARSSWTRCFPRLARVGISSSASSSVSPWFTRTFACFTGCPRNWGNSSPAYHRGRCPSRYEQRGCAGRASRPWSPAN